MSDFRNLNLQFCRYTNPEVAVHYIYVWYDLDQMKDIMYLYVNLLSLFFFF